MKFLNMKNIYFKFILILLFVNTYAIYGQQEISSSEVDKKTITSKVKDSIVFVNGKITVIKVGGKENALKTKEPSLVVVKEKRNDAILNNANIVK